MKRLVLLVFYRIPISGILIPLPSIQSQIYTSSSRLLRFLSCSGYAKSQSYESQLARDFRNLSVQRVARQQVSIIGYQPLNLTGGFGYP
jgi:hypothetical protein